MDFINFQDNQTQNQVVVYLLFYAIHELEDQKATLKF